MHFSNDRQRASKTPSVEIPDEVLRVHLERAHFIVIGVNDIDRAPVVSQRALRAAGRTDQDTEEMVDETVQENAGADFEEDEADEAEDDEEDVDDLEEDEDEDDAWGEEDDAEQSGGFDEDDD
jgi:hypothetical protein